MSEKILYSFERGKLIKSIFADMAEEEGKSVSVIAERTILNALMPTCKNIYNIVTLFLYNKEGGDIGRTLAHFFGYNTAGANSAPKHDNLLLVVQFAANQEIFCNYVLTGEEEERYHAINKMDSILHMLEMLAENESDDLTRKYYLQNQAKWMKELLNIFEKEPQFSVLRNFYQIILNSWDELKKLDVTYELLEVLCKIQKGWRTDASAKIELLQVLKLVSDEWTDERKVVF